MLNLLENKRSKTNTPKQNHEESPTAPSRKPCEDLNLNLNIMYRPTKLTDLFEKIKFVNENPIDKPDSPLPLSADFLAEEMSFINEVVNFDNPADIFEVMPTVENLYTNLSNISSNSDSSSDCFKIQNVRVTIHNMPLKENEPPQQNHIAKLSVSNQENLLYDKIDTLTPVLSPLMSFSPTSRQCEGEFDYVSYFSEYTDTPLSSSTSERRKIQKKKDKGRLRERYQSMWLDEKRKHNLDRGLEYTDRTGLTHQKKKMKAACKCPKKCFEKLEKTARQKIFNNFWELGDHTRQWDFLSKYVSKLEKKQKIRKEVVPCNIHYQ